MNYLDDEGRGTPNVEVWRAIKNYKDGNKSLTISYAVHPFSETYKTDFIEGTIPLVTKYHYYGSDGVSVKPDVIAYCLSIGFDIPEVDLVLSPTSPSDFVAPSIFEEPTPVE